MKIEDKNQIIEFFSRDLSEQEKKDFLMKAGSDKEFVKELVKMAELNEVFEEFYSIKDERPSRNKTKNIRRFLFTLSAAALITFGLFFSIQRSQFNSDPGSSLFKEFYEPFDVMLTRSSDIVARSSDNSISFIKIYNLYIQKEYKTLVNINPEDIELNEIKESVYIMQGISAIEVGDCDKAQNLFHLVNPESNYISVAKWYLLLLSIQDNQFDKVIPELEEFANNNLLFMDKAEELEDKIIRRKLVD
jgi:hypothetical protein